ncbi:DNA cytosine methyltransferase [Paenibacillus barengoltzii]|uniref:DNA cytosine methyltransferase n=1 Tax=Paenibacillus barengoltzii TaxID=343517 RepID=UPI002DB63F23|nr:DNA cytosine methyltransferase [Paenibacillus barengoltzii]MEC2345015.1 DNA cytosine methyltransferase [Paenibacillus barengoltzii]
MFKVIDLFAGVGGLGLGFTKAGFNVVIANEIDPEIAMAHKMNQPNTKMINEDITKLDIDSVFRDLKGKVSVVVGGPPCQGFSQKGARKLLDDDRNFLFKYYFKVVEYIRPDYFLMENVPNILTSGNGYFKEEIYDLFQNIGYTLDSDVLNAYDFGVPQMRRRAFILGKKGDTPLSLPKGNNKKVSIIEAIGDLSFLESGEGQEIQDYKFEPSTNYQKEMRNGSEKLYNHIATKHSEIALTRMKMIPIGKGKEVLPKEHLTKSIYSGTWSRMIAEEPSVTITTRFDTPSSGRFTHPFLNRAITVREAARIQSFPDTFRFFGTKSSQMKQVGNAVPPLLAKAVANIIKADILKKTPSMILTKV